MNLRATTLILFLISPLTFLAAQQSPEPLGDVARRVREKKSLEKEGKLPNAPLPTDVSAENPELPSTPAQIAQRREAKKGRPKSVLPHDESNWRLADTYRDSIQFLIFMEDFETLEAESKANLQTKAKFTGGAWKQYWLYEGVLPFRRNPMQITPTAKDWREFFVRLRHWREEYQDSDTAKVATAAAYLEWAWSARGSGTSDQLTQEGSKLFEERASKANAILEEISKRGVTDPHVYYLQMQVAKALGRDPLQTTEIAKNAASLEPGYYATFQAFLDYLEPKWYGEEGMQIAFATALADHVGGDMGDYLYFTLATSMDCDCRLDEKLDLRQLSWSRAQKGFAAGEKMYGLSYYKLNRFTHLATVLGDKSVAKLGFQRIGNNIDYDIWYNADHFQSLKAWSFDVAASDLPAIEMTR